MIKDKFIQMQVEAQRKIDRTKNELKLKWENNSINIIKYQITARKKLGLKNDWKIKFYESKLKSKPKIISKIMRLLK